MDLTIDVDVDAAATVGMRQGRSGAATGSRPAAPDRSKRSRTQPQCSRGLSYLVVPTEPPHRMHVL
ncbi:hypothetical protein ACFQ0D_37285, partial [Micromonospora zhanjiangensis]